MKATVREFLGECDDPRTGKERLRILLEIAYRRVRQGSAKHLEMLLDRGWDKAKQGVEMGGSLSLSEAIEKARNRAAASPANGNSDTETAQQAEKVSDAPATEAAESPRSPVGRVTRIVM
jgi:hypothetical protein